LPEDKNRAFSRRLSMQVYCLRCGKSLAPAEIQLDERSAHCTSCGASFSIRSELNERIRTIERILLRPADALSTVEPQEGALSIRVPSGRRLLRAFEWTAFGSFYLVVVIWWTQSAMSDSRNPLAWNAIVLLVGIFLSTLGLVPFATALWALFGGHRIEIDADRARFETCCKIANRHPYRSQHEIPQSELRFARERLGVPFKLAIGFKRKEYDAAAASYGVEIVHEHGSFVCPVASRPEALWLAQTINDFLDAIRPADRPVETRPNS
jgi:hypothetical protein